jgi:glutaryl-CoA dehydrogenase
MNKMLLRNVKTTLQRTHYDDYYRYYPLLLGNNNKSSNTLLITKRNSSTFSTSDPFQLDLDMLTDEEKKIRDLARKYGEKHLKPRIIDAFRNETFDRSIMNEMGELGLLGSTIPSEYGGAGLGYVGYGLIAKEIEAIDSGYRSALSVQSSLVMGPIFEHGSEEQKKRLLPELASGKLVGCFGLTEPGSGSDAGGMKTVAVLDGNEYILNGTKTWITNAPIADVLIVWAKTSSLGSAGVVRGFVIERDKISSGDLTTPKINGKLSLRASITGQISMQDVRVAKSAILPNVQGMRGPFSCLNRARYGISWGVMGAAESCFRIATEYGTTRQQFGHPLVANQLQQMKLADMLTDISLGTLASLRLGRMMESDYGCPVESISMLKRNNCLKALSCARTARDMLGANGIADEYHVMRIANNLEAVNTYEGTADVHALILGKAITGISAF